MADSHLLELLSRAGRTKILFLGQCDTGKTILLEEVGKHLARSSSVAVVDADVGQSHIGPPTTIGWARLNEDFTSWLDLEPQAMYFVGSTSPHYHLLPTALGTLRISGRAAITADQVLIDTPGFVLGESARALFWHIIDSLQPEFVVAVQRADELQHILDAYRGASWPEVVETSPSPACVEKTREDRTDYRESLFHRYFASSHEIEICWDDVPVRARGLIDHSTEPDVINRLVSLRNATGEDIALGTITRLSLDRHTLTLRTPLAPNRVVACVVFGSVRLTPEGREIPWPEGTRLPIP